MIFQKIDYEKLNCVLKNFNNETINNPDIQKQKENKKKSARKKALIYFILYVVFSLIIMQLDSNRSQSGDLIGYFGIASFISSLVAIYYFFSSFTVTNKKVGQNIKNDIKKIVASGIKKYSLQQNDLQFEELSLLNAKSEEDLLLQAFDLQADAIINYNVKERSDVKSVGVSKSIIATETIKTFEGVAVKIHNKDAKLYFAKDELIAYFKENELDSKVIEECNSIAK